MANNNDPSAVFAAFMGADGPPKSKFEEKGKDFLNCIQFLRANPNCPIYHYQIDAVVATHELLVKEARIHKPDPVLIVAPTGSGKSGMIFMLPYVLQAKKVLVITPSTILSEQLGETFGLKNQVSFVQKVEVCQRPDMLQGFLENGLIVRSSNDIGPDPLVNLVIVNAQKFGGRSRTSLSLVYRNMDIIENVQSFFKEFDLLIVDEAHHYPAETWLNIKNEFQRASVVGLRKQIIFLTATPHRMMPGGLFKPILPEQRISYTVTAAKLKETTIRETEFVEKTDDSQLRKDISELLAGNSLREPRTQHQAMILVLTKKDAQQISDRLNEGIKPPKYAVALVSDQATVKQDTEGFTKGEYTVAVTCGLLKEGYDNSSVTVCVILRKVKSKVLFNQFIGRCMRKKKMPVEDSDDDEHDKSLGRILSYKKFGQRKNWDEREALAQEDPIDIEDD